MEGMLEGEVLKVIGLTQLIATAPFVTLVVQPLLLVEYLVLLSVQKVLLEFGLGI